MLIELVAPLPFPSGSGCCLPSSHLSLSRVFVLVLSWFCLYRHERSATICKIEAERAKRIFEQSINGDKTAENVVEALLETETQAP